MRGRGGNNNGRKGPNTLNRSYESNGPDVKIRGTAQQIADKYTTLARDAQSSGDRVIAENYLQHAEHYNRIIATAQAQNQAQQSQGQENQVQESQVQASRDNRDDFDDDFEREDRDEREREDRDERENRDRRENARQAGSSGASRQNQSQQKVDDGSGPQPVIDGVPVEVALKEEHRNRANGAKPNGRAKPKTNGAEDKPQPVEAEAGEAGSAKEAQEDNAEEKPKPKRTRRPRAKKAAEPVEDGEARSEETAAAE